MSSTIGDNLTISIFGQSHSKAIGVVIDGIPAGETLDMERLQAFLLRRAPGRSENTAQRKEEDVPVFLSGLVGNATCGAPLCAIIENRDARPEDYEALRDVPRPSHSDYAAFEKYGTFHDIRGGGHFSGRLTAPLCIAGGICIQMLEKRGVTIGAHIAAIASVDDAAFDPVLVNASQLKTIAAKAFPVIDEAAGERMKAEIALAAKDGDSVGGIVEACAIGVPTGVGQPMFDGIENNLAKLIFGIPAVKGVEFGAGFKSSRLRGSENNDAFYYDAMRNVQTRTNRHGGSLGGISSGMPILVRAAFKPTPSVAREQESVSLSQKENTSLHISGRHDPCIVPRAVPCMEAAMAVALLDLMMSHAGEKGFSSQIYEGEI
jgi:chorismate synthase